jgi:hypothetical protein
MDAQWTHIGVSQGLATAPWGIPQSRWARPRISRTRDWLIPFLSRLQLFGYIDIYRVNVGRIAEAWHIEDVAHLMRQLATAAPDGVTT